MDCQGSSNSLTFGGGIYNGHQQATLTITASTISDNAASGGLQAYGGGIFNEGSVLTATDTKISNNSAVAINAGRGGGIYSGGGEATVTRGALSNNAASGKISEGAGGGIYYLQGTLTLQTASKITLNFASNYGGGIYASDTVTISPDTTVGTNIPNDVYYD